MSRSYPLVISHADNKKNFAADFVSGSFVLSFLSFFILFYTASFLGGEVGGLPGFGLAQRLVVVELWVCGTALRVWMRDRGKRGG